MLVSQVEFILDTIEKNGLDFHDNENLKDLSSKQESSSSSSRFPSGYRHFIHKTFHGIDEKAYYLFKYAYHGDRRYAYERIEWYHDFEEFLPITNK
jgi:hypothetical protein